jgi:hypothetical protein
MDFSGAQEGGQAGIGWRGFVLKSQRYRQRLA